VRGWLRRHRSAAAADIEPVAERVGPVPPALGAGELASSFAAPQWLRNVGRTSWLLVGFLLLLAGLVWLLGATYTITGPVVAAAIVATVAMPIVAWLTRHMPRGVSAGLVLLGVLAIGVVLLLIVLGGITAQEDGIGDNLSAAANTVESWLNSLGVHKSASSSAQSEVSSALPQILSTLTKGVINGINGLTSLAFGLSFFMLGLFFLLKDGPSMRRWVDRHLGVPAPAATIITGRVIGSLRGYFRGVTIVAVFNGVVVAFGAWLLGVPLAGTIGIVTFVTAYVPYIGAFVSGAFAVLIALGSEGTQTALIMLVIVILANGLLQNIFQPFAMGSALDLNPLVVLVITISAGCIFGMLGLVLAAPLTSAAVKITRDLSYARTTATDRVGGEEAREMPEAGSAAAPPAYKGQPS
jgi:predicted PurR-regulated permease PerM